MGLLDCSYLPFICPLSDVNVVHPEIAPPHGVPTIISRLLGIDYERKICTQAFPPGEHYRVPLLPNVTAVNALGDCHTAADRLAFIDGEGM